MKTIVILALLWVGGASAAESCATFGRLQFLCGPESAEDLVRVGHSPWLIAGGLAEGTKAGHLYVIDTRNKHWDAVYPTGKRSPASQPRRFPDCTTEPDALHFSAHGIALRSVSRGRYELLVAAHGSREAIEFFDVRMRSGRPSIHWMGCVPIPADSSMNSVVPLVDGGFIATKFYAPSLGGMGAVFAGKITGGLMEWHPGGAVTTIPGTELSGANGIEVSDNGRVIFVAAWGVRELVRFERAPGGLVRKTVPLDFAGDNLRWSQDGKSLLVGGQKFKVMAGGAGQLDGWSVARVDPVSMAVNKLFEVDGSAPMQGVSVAVEVDREIWVGPFRGDRVGYFTSDVP
jgi:sugar lactone lactonase YvrE